MLAAWPHFLLLELRNSSLVIFMSFAFQKASGHTQWEATELNAAVFHSWNPPLYPLSTLPPIATQ